MSLKTILQIFDAKGNMFGTSSTITQLIRQAAFSTTPIGNCEALNLKPTISVAIHHLAGSGFKDPSAALLHVTIGARKY